MRIYIDNLSILFIYIISSWKKESFALSQSHIFRISNKYFISLESPVLITLHEEKWFHWEGHEKWSYQLIISASMYVEDKSTAKLRDVFSSKNRWRGSFARRRRHRFNVSSSLWKKSSMDTLTASSESALTRASAPSPAYTLLIYQNMKIHSFKLWFHILSHT